MIVPTTTRFWFVIVLFVSSSSLVFGQSQIKGKLQDSNGSPISYATIALYAKDSALVDGTLSDTEGSFTLKGIKTGSYALSMQFLGFERQVVPVKFEGVETQDLGVLVLKPSTAMLQDVTITGERVTAAHKADRQVYNAASFGTSEGGQAVDVLRNLPSVSLDALGNLSIRGTSGYVVLVDGRPIQGDALAFLGQVPANAIQSIELITAPSARYDPEGKGGIINVITKKGISDGFFAQVNGKWGLPSIQDYDNAEAASRYGGDFSLYYRQGKIDFSIGGSFQRNDLAGRREGDVYTIISDTITRFPSDGERSFDEVNYSGRLTLGYFINAKNTLNLGFYAGSRTKDRTADILYYDNHARRVGADDRIYTFTYFNENLRVRTGDFVLGSLDYKHVFENEGVLTSSVLYEYTLLGGPTTNLNLHPDTRFVYQEEYNTNENPLDGYRANLDYIFPKKAFGELRTGYQFRYLDHRGDFVYLRRNAGETELQLVPESSSTVNLSRAIHAAYLEIGSEHGKWSYTAGLRMEAMQRSLGLQDRAGIIDTTFRYDFIKPFPSASLTYEMSAGWVMKSAYSRRVSRTTTFKMNPFPEREHSETSEQGDPELLPEFVDLVELGARLNKDAYGVFATAYFRNTANLVNRVNTIENDTILNRIYSNVGTGRAWGMEAGLEWNPLQVVNLFAGGNLYKYKIDGSYNERPVNTSAWVYSVNANASLDLPKGWSVQATFNYLSDRVTAQGEDSRYYNPSLTLKKSFLDRRLVATAQWLNIDMGLWSANEQRITTWQDGDFFTTTNYVYEVDMVILNLSYNFTGSKNKARFIKSEFGDQEF